MKKSILKLGKILTRVEQQKIEGGRFFCCINNPECPSFNETSCIIIAGRCLYEASEGIAC